MNKKNLLNILLVFIVASLATIIYYSEDDSTLLERLTDVDPSLVNKITIKHNNHSTLINRQSKNQWLITHPVNIEANNFRIKSIIKLINAPIHQHYKLNEIDLNKTGLNSSKTQVTFDDITFTFGNTNPATGLRYIKLNNQVATIEDVYYPLLSSHYGTLASLNLIPTDTTVANSGIEKLILLNQTISKDENGLWQSNAKSTADTIAKIIDHWQHDQAFGVHEYLQRKLLGEVYIYIKDQPQPITYILTDDDPWLILARPDLGLEYHIDIKSYKNLISPE